MFKPSHNHHRRRRPTIIFPIITSRFCKFLRDREVGEEGAMRVDVNNDGKIVVHSRDPEIAAEVKRIVQGLLDGTIEYEEVEISDERERGE
jgi:hypothetical protein